VYNLSNTTEPEEFNLHKKILSFNPVEIIWWEAVMYKLSYSSITNDCSENLIPVKLISLDQIATNFPVSNDNLVTKILFVLDSPIT
jgi:hypothetical protein